MISKKKNEQRNSFKNFPKHFFIVKNGLKKLKIIFALKNFINLRNNLQI